MQMIYVTHEVPGLASDSYIFPRDPPQTEKLLDSDPHFEDPDTFARMMLVIGF